jgi:hypothetical protein
MYAYMPELGVDRVAEPAYYARGWKTLRSLGNAWNCLDEGQCKPMYVGEQYDATHTVATLPQCVGLHGPLSQRKVSMKTKSPYAVRNVWTQPAVHRRTKRTINSALRKAGIKPSACVTIKVQE